MRWKRKYPKGPRYICGNTRIKEKFLLRPRCLSTNPDDISDLEIYEWRWLEKTKIRQRCKDYYKVLWFYIYSWQNQSWYTPPPEIEEEEISEEAYFERIGL